jgi:hypothetical protein
MAKRVPQAKERVSAEQHRDPERKRAEYEHRRGRGREWDVVEREGADQAALDPADTARDRQQPPELTDQVGNDQYSEGRKPPEGLKADAEHRDIERHVAERAGDHPNPRLTQKAGRVASARADAADEVADRRADSSRVGALITDAEVSGGTGPGEHHGDRNDPRTGEAERQCRGSIAVEYPHDEPQARTG